MREREKLFYTYSGPNIITEGSGSLTTFFISRSSTGPNDQAEGQTQNERPNTLAFQEPETSELGPISRLSVSTPVLDEGDHSPR